MAAVLDIEQADQLIAYLRAGGRIGADESPRVRVLAGGVSNRTVLVTRDTGEAWVLKQALAKLRVAVDWFSDPMRIHREAAGLRWLDRLLNQHNAQPTPTAAATPQPLPAEMPAAVSGSLPGAGAGAGAGVLPGVVFEDFEHHILAMQAVPQPHENWKSMLLAGRLQVHHIAQFATLLATMHRRAFESRHEVAEAFADRSFFESLRLEPYYGYAAGQVAEARTFLETLIADTRATRLTLVHGDYSPKNILVHNDRLVLLDHEVIHFGDPAFDVGFSTTHLLSKAHHLPDHRDAFADAAAHYWRTYARTLGDVPWRDALEARAARHTLGCLLARVAGRSPLEYLSEHERARQRAAVTKLMQHDTRDMATLIGRFLEAV